MRKATSSLATEQAKKGYTGATVQFSAELVEKESFGLYSATMGHGKASRKAVLKICSKEGRGTVPNALLTLKHHVPKQRGQQLGNC